MPYNEKTPNAIPTERKKKHHHHHHQKSENECHMIQSDIYFKCNNSWKILPVFIREAFPTSQQLP